MSSPSKTRFRFIAAATILVAFFFILRLAYLQLWHGQRFRDEANRQYVSPGNALFDRGSIFFSEKSGTLVAAATLRPSYFLSVNPQHVSDPDLLWEKLSPFLASSTKENFLTSFSDTRDTYEVLGKGISEEIAEKLGKLSLQEIQIHRNQERIYPSRALAAPVLGFVAQTKDSGDALLGQAGLERYYESTLSRKEQKLYVNFFAKLFGDLSNVLFDRTGAKEGNVVLTIEPTVQNELEIVLAEVLREYRGKEVGGIILDPKGGEILAMGALPTFDPSDIKSANPKLLRNPLVQSVYELGSIVKPLTLAAALDAGAITPETTYNDKGYLDFAAGATIRNYDGKGRGVVPMQEVLNQSLNTGAVFAMQELGTKRFQRYLHNFGFGELTGIDLPSEAQGLTDTIESGRPIELATDSFGQGFAVTPIAMTRALAALGNGGLIVRPHVTKEINYKFGGKEIREPVIERRVLDERTSLTITRMLVRVVDTALAHGTAKLEHYSVAAKTGTAQIPKPGGGYSADRYLHSFFGYAPAYDPKFLIFLYIKEPQGVKYASETLTKPFFDTMKFLLHYYEVPPDR